MTREQLEQKLTDDVLIDAVAASEAIYRGDGMYSAGREELAAMRAVLVSALSAEAAPPQEAKEPIRVPTM